MHVRLMNWQTASRNVGDLASPNTVHRTTGTRHVEDYVEDPGLIYLAPETTRADPAQGPSLDVFSLGCIAYYLFSGQPPAESVLDLAEKLRVGQGLRLSDTMDGCGARQQELIQFATYPDLLARYDSIQGFLDDLDRVEDELTTPDPEATVDPSIASTGDRLEGGFTVVKRVGRGSSSDALLVRRDGSEEEHILKVACDIAHNDRLVAEGEVLARLHHQNIVAHRETLTVAGRTALLLKSAGARTLAEKIKDEGRLSLDMLQRFGEELMEAVNHLESEGVAHRDIKPENIGIAENRTGKLQLVLFDFSLCRTPADNITAGTHPYLDPFLSMRRPPRWDLYAERLRSPSPCTRWRWASPPSGATATPRQPCSTSKPASRAMFSIRSPARASPPSSPRRSGATTRNASITLKRCCAPGAPSSRPGRPSIPAKRGTAPPTVASARSR
jgi:serine/threonine protein kinase